MPATLPEHYLYRDCVRTHCVRTHDVILFFFLAGKGGVAADRKCDRKCDIISGDVIAYVRAYVLRGYKGTDVVFCFLQV
jgi:hypothetical protein